MAAATDQFARRVEGIVIAQECFTASRSTESPSLAENAERK